MRNVERIEIKKVFLVLTEGRQNKLEGTLCVQDEEGTEYRLNAVNSLKCLFPFDVDKIIPEQTKI